MPTLLLNSYTLRPPLANGHGEQSCEKTDTKGIITPEHIHNLR